MRLPTVFAVCSSIVVLAAIGAALMVLGSPGEARKRRLDELRVRDLNAISNSLETYRRTHDDLPASLDQLSRPNGPAQSFSDPESKARYEYRPLGREAFELCARFQTTADATTDTGAANAFWHHGPGRKCFRIEVRAPGKVRE